MLNLEWCIHLGFLPGIFCIFYCFANFSTVLGQSFRVRQSLWGRENYLRRRPQNPFGRKSAFSPKMVLVPGSGTLKKPIWHVPDKVVQSTPRVQGLKSPKIMFWLFFLCAMHHQRQENDRRSSFNYIFDGPRLRCSCEKILESLLFHKENVELDFITQA